MSFLSDSCYSFVVSSHKNFDAKIQSLIYKVARKTGIDVQIPEDQDKVHKIKFIVKESLSEDSLFPTKFRDFEVVHNYLRTSSPGQVFQ